MSDYPDPNELVVCRLKSIKNYGAFVDLMEYEKEGFVHVSNIASGWVKNIRSHVSEGQIRVAQVVRVDMQKDLIDLSLRKVSDNQEKRKMSEYKRAKRADKLFERIAKHLNEDHDEAYAKIAEPMKDEFGDLYSAFESMSATGADAIKSLKLPKKWVEALVELAKESVTAPEVTISGTLMMKMYTPDGVETIKSALKKLEKPGVNVAYISAPDYQLSVTAPDYPEAEKMLKNAMESVEKDFKKKGEISFERAQK